MDFAGVDAFVTAVLTGTVIKVFDHFTGKRGRKVIHDRMDVMEQELRNGATGTPTDHNSTLRTSVDRMATVVDRVDARLARVEERVDGIVDRVDKVEAGALLFAARLVALDRKDGHN